MEALQKILLKLNASGITFEELTPLEREQMNVDDLNAMEGDRHLEDGYECELCKNKGRIYKVVECHDGSYTHTAVFCKCEDTRRSILQMKKSGLKDVIKTYTFDRYETPEAWQKTLKGAAVEYAKNPEGWFFLGGQSGAGKTHLCTAICRKFLLDGNAVVYMAWRDDIAKLKALAMEPEQRAEMINRYKQSKVLYIDDLFKTGKNPDGSKQKPTSADINTAFEIINYRYNNPSLYTIVSSEWTEDELLDIDEATGGRIFERAKTFSIAPDRSRNYRTRKTVTV